MAQLTQLFDHLLETPGSTLVLDSNTLGAFHREGGKPRNVFRTALSTGQILLLFADIVPKWLSTKLLSGTPVDFQHRLPAGLVDIHMALKGDDLRVTAKAAAKAPPALVPAPARLGPPAPDQAPQVTLLALMNDMAVRRASHLHVNAGRLAQYRCDGLLVPVQGAYFDDAQLAAEVEALVPAALKRSLQASRLDFTHLTNDAVFRVGVQRSDNGLSVVVRHRPRSVSVGSLGLPPELAQAMVSGGLWVLSSPAGHGLSTTLAAVMQTVVERPVSVRCLEPSIEFMLAPGEGPLTQLEVGASPAALVQALRDALRDDVDVVMVSRLDDPEVLRAVLDLTERGKLVVCGLHARGAAQAAEELFHLTNARPVARSQLGQTLRGVFAQVLCRNTEGGRSLAWELLPGLPSVRAALADGRVGVLPSLRTRSLEQSLVELLSQGLVERDEALAVAPDSKAFEAVLGRAARARPTAAA